MSSVGKGVEELRVWDDSGTYRVVYIARFTEAVYVLHAFQKKTRATSERDIELARLLVMLTRPDRSTSSR